MTNTEKRSPYIPSQLLAWVVVGSTLALPAAALEVSGSARVAIGTTESAGVENDEEDQVFQLRLDQELSPWLKLFGSFRSTRFNTRFGQEEEFERTSNQPEIGLAYDRSRLNARVLFADRAIRTTDENQDLDIRTFLASLDWRPTHGPRMGFRLYDTTSTADAALFGRDSRARNLSFRLDYSKSRWSARYSLEQSDLDNRVTGLSLEQTQHELRASYFENFWDDRWSFNVDGRFADVSQSQQAATGATASLPVAAVQGLFAIDPSPSLGALEPEPQLIDGDFAQAVASGIEIGGANTFRNIGVDLGVSRPVSALEISVDAPSGPVTWQVWESPDNSSWFRVATNVSFFDAGLLRYTIRFPETTARFFKAVNVSVNTALQVSVTEVRALRTTNQLERTEGSGEEYWLNLQTSLRPTDRILVSVAANLRRDQDLVATDLRRSYDEQGLSAQLRLDLTGELELRMGYRFADLEENAEEALERREELSTAELDWRPLDTVNLVLAAQRREETDGDELLATTDSLTLQAVTEIFPNLSLTSTFGIADTVDTLFGFSQESRYVIGSLEAWPNDRWLLNGVFSRYEYDSVGSVAVTFRTTAQLRASWFATPFLSVSADWLTSQDDLGDIDTRRLGLQWAPGPKLSVGSSYYDTRSSAGAGTSNFSFDGSYRINRSTRLWLTVNEAESQVTLGEPVKTEALRLGFNLIF